MIVDCQFRSVVTNLGTYKSDVVYETGYVNLALVQYVFVMGDVARVIYGKDNYVEMDLSEWKRISSTL